MGLRDVHILLLLLAVPLAGAKRLHAVHVTRHVDGLIVLPDHDHDVLVVDGLHVAPLKLVHLLLGWQGDAMQPVLAECACDTQLPVT